ncbi:MAG: chemotaxis response regulator protein-glutamate methylesterase [Anaerolineales bacterium]
MALSNSVRVLVVDDSSYIRKVVSQMLSRHPAIQVVGTARNGRDALVKVSELSPDVVTLDLLMPELDGLGFLKEQMARRPLPVVIVSIASEGGQMAISAMELGALEFVQKPTALALSSVFDIERDLTEKVLTAASVAHERLPVMRDHGAPAAAVLPLPVRGASGRVDAVVIGLSTGGPQALRHLLAQLPGDFPVPLAVVVHMPPGYTAAFAERLNQRSALEVLEAHEGLPMRPGRVLLAPGGLHLTLQRQPDDMVTVHLNSYPLDKPHRPSVDVLFQSAAEVYGDRILGVVMTGMGSDGRDGAAWIKAQGGIIFTEAEPSCVVYGMPRSVVEANLSDREVLLENMAAALLETV